MPTDSLAEANQAFTRPPDAHPHLSENRIRQKVLEKALPLR
jgi:hypothetical protein